MTRWATRILGRSWVQFVLVLALGVFALVWFIDATGATR